LSPYNLGFLSIEINACPSFFFGGVGDSKTNLKKPVAE
jgi:hypothetical protein